MEILTNLWIRWNKYDFTKPPQLGCIVTMGQGEETEHRTPKKSIHWLPVCSLMAQLGSLGTQTKMKLTGSARLGCQMRIMFMQGQSTHGATKNTAVAMHSVLWTWGEETDGLIWKKPGEYPADCLMRCVCEHKCLEQKGSAQSCQPAPYCSRSACIKQDNGEDLTWQIHVIISLEAWNTKRSVSHYRGLSKKQEPLENGPGTNYNN